MDNLQIDRRERMAFEFMKILVQKNGHPAPERADIAAMVLSDYSVRLADALEDRMRRGPAGKAS